MNDIEKDDDIELSRHYTIPGLIRYAAVPMLTMLLVSVYMVVDGLFIANFTSETSYAGCILVTPYVMIFPAIGFMVGGGGNALLGKLLGENERERAVDVFSMLVEFTLIAVIVTTTIGALFMKSFLTMQGASGELLSEALSYGKIVMLGTVFLALQYELQLFMITSGKEELTFVYTLIAGITNIGLDAFLILVVGMGVRGAAIGTVTAQFVGSLLPFIYYIRSRKKDEAILFFRWTKCEFKPIADSCINGLSEMIENIAESIAGFVYNYKLMAIAGEAGVDSYGSVMYVFIIFTVLFVGFNESLVPMIGYHYGARNLTELKGLIKKCFLILFGYSLLFAVISIGFANQLSAIFSDGNKVIYELGVTGFRICGISLLLKGCAMFFPSLYTGLNNGWLSALLSLFEILVFPVISVLILPVFFGMDGVWWSEPFSWLLSAIMCVIVVRLSNDLQGNL